MVTAKNNYDYTGAARQSAYVERLKAKGLKQTRVWVYLDDVPKIVDFAAELVTKREKGQRKNES